MHGISNSLLPLKRNKWPPRDQPVSNPVSSSIPTCDLLEGLARFKALCWEFWWTFHSKLIGLMLPWNKKTTVFFSFPLQLRSNDVVLVGSLRFLDGQRRVCELAQSQSFGARRWSFISRRVRHFLTSILFQETVCHFSHSRNGQIAIIPKPELTQPMDPEKKVWTYELIFPTKYVIPKSLKFSHWPSKWIFHGFWGDYLTFHHHLEWPTGGNRSLYFAQLNSPFSELPRISEVPVFTNSSIIRCFFRLSWDEHMAVIAGFHAFPWWMC